MCARSRSCAWRRRAAPVCAGVATRTRVSRAIRLRRVGLLVVGHALQRGENVSGREAELVGELSYQRPAAFGDGFGGRAGQAGDRTIVHAALHPEVEQGAVCRPQLGNGADQSA